MRAFVQARDRHHTARVPGERVEDRDTGGGERLHALGQMFEACYLDQPLLAKGGAYGVGPEERFGVLHTREVMLAVERSPQLRIPLIALQQPGPLVVEHQSHADVRDCGPEPLQHRSGHPDEDTVHVDLNRIGEPELLQDEADLLAPAPRFQDGRPNIPLYRLPFKEPFEDRLGACGHAVPPKPVTDVVPGAPLRG
ncbi:hypothetical protein ACQP1V_27575 [Microtetraspora malaysiensis]|uniref:hypothetical protein n=1 Tax=Microtetraspora malaysiensis TaxID=161358 RepID=UPI003D943D8C